MKKMFKILIMAFFIFTGCAKTRIVEDFRIADEHREDYNMFQVNYGAGLKNVRLLEVPIESGKIYYVKPGEYDLTYEYMPKVAFNMTLNYNGEAGKRDKNEKRMDNRQKEVVNIQEDTEINLDEKNTRVVIQGEVSK